jgi:rod shape-determining protein MreD
MRTAPAMKVNVHAEGRIEVYHYNLFFVAITVLLSLVMQASLERLGLRGEYIELPLLVTMYFGLSRRNASRGLLLGMCIGLLQDGLSQVPVGLYGIAKTIVGYLSSTIGARIDVEHPLSRMAFGFIFFHVQQVSLAVTSRVLLGQQVAFFDRRLLVGSLVNAVLAPLLFPLLDRFRRTD